MTELAFGVPERDAVAAGDANSAQCIPVVQTAGEGDNAYSHRR
jgi:hypothetical protein